MVKVLATGVEKAIEEERNVVKERTAATEFSYINNKRELEKIVDGVNDFYMGSVHRDTNSVTNLVTALVFFAKQDNTSKVADVYKDVFTKDKDISVSIGKTTYIRGVLKGKEAMAVLRKKENDRWKKGSGFDDVLSMSEMLDLHSKLDDILDSKIVDSYKDLSKAIAGHQKELEEAHANLTAAKKQAEDKEVKDMIDFFLRAFRLLNEAVAKEVAAITAFLKDVEKLSKFVNSTVVTL